MNKAICQLMLFVFAWLLFSTGAEATPRITAPSYILMDAKNGTILIQSNAHEKRPPASTTKILTGILALDLADKDELVLISKTAARVGEATIYLQTGEIFVLEDLIKGALIKSGNDAAFAIAEHVAGDEKLFMDLANRKARILGALQTEFYNPHGLPHDQHLTSSFDLGMITRYSLQDPLFISIVGTRETVISPLNYHRKIYLTNTNRLLWSDETILGVKTGTTIKAGKCLVSAAEKDNYQLIAVVLKSNDRFGDAKRLLDWGFSKLQ